MLTVAENSPGATLVLMNDAMKDGLLRHPDYLRTVQGFAIDRTRWAGGHDPVVIAAPSP